MMNGGNLKTGGNLLCHDGALISDGEANITKDLIVYTTEGESPSKFRQTGGDLEVGSLGLEKAIVSGGTILAKGDSTLNYDMTLSGGSVEFKDSFAIYGNGGNTGFTGTGGTLDVAKNLEIDKDALISGSNVSAKSEGVYIHNGNLTVTKGSLTGINTAGGTGILVDRNTTIEGTGNVRATAENARSFYTQRTLTVNGGTVNATNNASPLSNNTAYSNLKAGSLIVTDGTVTATAAGTAGRAIDIDSTISISGGSVSGSAAGASSIWIAVYSKDGITANGGMLTGGTKDSRAAGLRTDGGITVSGTADVSGKSFSGDGVYAKGAIEVKGGSLSGFSSTRYGVYAASTIDVSAGSLNGTSYDQSGVYAGGTVNMEGGSLIGSSASQSGVFAAGTINVKGGKLSGGSGGNGINADTIKTTGGEVSAYSTASNGMFVKKLEVSGGTVFSEAMTSSPFSGIRITDSFKMTGGKVTGKTQTETPAPVYAPLAGTDLADNIWMSDPADGYNNYNGYISSDYLYEYGHDMAKTKTATFQEVTGISVKTAPSATLYKGDYFDPAGLVLNLTFADGTVTDLTYDQYHKDMFSFGLSQSEPLSAGNPTVGVDCLTHNTQFDLAVKDLGVPVLSGTAGYSQKLEWTQADGAESYYLYGKKEGESSYTLLTSGNVKRYEHYSGTPGETWEYYVNTSRQSASGAVTGSDSNHVILTSMIDRPWISLSGSSYDSASISWEAVTGATGYEVCRAEGGGSFEKISYVTGTAFSDTGLVTGREYKYYVIAAIPDKDIYSDPSNTVTVTPGFAGKTTLELTGDGVNTLSWQAVDGATGYEVLRGDGKDGKRAALISTDAETTTYTDEAIDIYSVYNYTVVPLRTIGEDMFRGQDSNVAVSVAKDKPEPPAPVIDPPKTDDPKGAKFNLLQAKAGKVTKNSVQIKWKKVKGAKKYVVYGNKCGSKNKYKKLSTTTKVSLVYKKVAGKKVKKGTYYKFIVYALGSDGKVISTSKTVHVATPGGRVGNDKKVTTAAKKGAVTLKKGKTFKLKAKAIPASKKLKVHRHRKMAYETSNKKIATVSSKGVIKATGKGTCYVYAYTQNGIFAKIRVTVK